MQKIKLIILFSVLSAVTLIAGNPDRQGESGAVELLMNPWARSAGLHSLTTSLVGGVEAMRINVAGLARIQKSEFVVGHTRYFSGTDINLNSLGFAQKIGEGSYIGVSLMAVDFGELEVTTGALPEGTGATFSPSYFNLGIGFSHIFENKITVGVLFRMISEGISDVSASGIALDAGVQYVTGERDNFKLGIALRNIGSRMRFSGEGLSFNAQNPNDTPIPVDIKGDVQSASFEMPSTLNIGISNDFFLTSQVRMTAVANFTSNAFSRDQLGAGLEFSFIEQFMIRGGYRLDVDNDVEKQNLYDGLSFGATVQVPFKKDGDSKFAIDYAYRATFPFDGTHNISIRIGL